MEFQINFIYKDSIYNGKDKIIVTLYDIDNTEVSKNKINLKLPILEDFVDTHLTRERRNKLYKRIQECIADSREKSDKNLINFIIELADRFEAYIYSVTSGGSDIEVGLSIIEYEKEIHTDYVQDSYTEEGYYPVEYEDWSQALLFYENEKRKVRGGMKEDVEEL